jgi:hypothetical protein
MLAALLWVAGSSLFGPQAADAGPERRAGVGLTTGARIFASRLELQNEAAIGLRVSLGVADRVSVLIDGSHSNPTRKTSGASSSFGDLRVLASYRLLPGRLAPYVAAGVGGQFFNFHDAPGTAGAVIAAGLGIEFAASREWALFAEATADFYRAQYHRFTETGTVLESSPAATYATGVVTAGAEFRF